MAGRGIYAQHRNESDVSFYPEAEAVREQVERIVSDPLFCNSKRYSNLLRFIAERSLDGRTADLKERIIGIEVFGRNPEYDTSLDATVRVAAAEVRKRLALYYKQTGHEQELRIDVPNGSYLAEFRLPEQTAPDPHPQLPSKRRKLLWYLGAAAAVVVLAVAVRSLPRALASRSAVDQFWAPLLTGSSPVAFYTPLKPASGYEELSTPSAAVNPEERFSDFLVNRGQVPVNDVNATSALTSYLQKKGKESSVRSARGANLSALRSDPAVLLGSFNNDWVIRLSENLRFRFRRESISGVRWIEDTSNPQNRTWGLDYSAPYGRVTEDYAVISRVLDPNTGQWFIAIGGLTGLATTAACEFVTDQNAMASLGTRLPKNWAGKNLQFVLAVKLIQGSPGASRVVATYSW